MALKRLRWFRIIGKVDLMFGIKMRTDFETGGDIGLTLKDQ